MCRTIVPLNVFIKFVEIAKTAKSDIVLLLNNNIYGLNGEMCIIKQVISETENFGDFNLICHTNAMVALLKNIVIKDLLTDVLYIDYITKTIYSPIDQNVSIPLLDHSSMSNMLNSMQYEVNNCFKTYHYDDIKNDINFIRCMAAKSDNGMQMYIKDGYAMSLYTGILSINKDDKVQLKIFDIDDATFISNFIISKKKKITLSVYVKYMKLK